MWIFKVSPQLWGLVSAIHMPSTPISRHTHHSDIISEYSQSTASQAGKGNVTALVEGKAAFYTKKLFPHTKSRMNYFLNMGALRNFYIVFNAFTFFLYLFLFNV